MTSQAQNKDIYDLIIVGSGAGALSAAVFAADQGLSALIIEKSDKYGGTSALSGGGIWIPNNSHFKAKGGNDSYEKALTYLRESTQGRVDEKRLLAYLDHAPAMIDYLEKNSRVRYAVAEKYPDYYPHLDGSLPGGRTLDPELFDITALGDEIENQRPASPSTLLMGKIAWTARSAHKAISRERGWRLMLVGLMLRYKFDFAARRKGRRDRRAGLGAALIAALRMSLLDRKVPLGLNTDFKDLVPTEGKVTDVIVEHKGETRTLTARKGGMRGYGGFEQNQALRLKYLPQPRQAVWSATPKGCNTGAALEAGIRAGSATDLLDWCWWAPTIKVPKENEARGIFAERAFPGAYVVDSLGKRFVNEASPYLEFGDAMYKNNTNTGGKSVPAWAVFDSRFRFNYAMGPLMPSQIMPDSRLPKHWENTVYWKAETLDELAEKISVDAAGLQQTADKVNHYSETGIDEEFQRGGNVFDLYYGDINVKPNPCMAPLAKGPFYAMRMDAGDIGTKGGLLTNEHGQVLKEDGSTLDGLYAIGYCSPPGMGTSYPGPGSSIGPAMTFG